MGGLHSTDIAFVCSEAWKNQGRKSGELRRVWIPHVDAAQPRCWSSSCFVSVLHKYLLIHTPNFHVRLCDSWSAHQGWNQWICAEAWKPDFTGLSKSILLHNLCKFSAKQNPASASWNNFHISSLISPFGILLSWLRKQPVLHSELVVPPWLKRLE